MEIRQAINLYLTAKAYKDEEFKTKFENPNKNLDECVGFITTKMYEKVMSEKKENDSFGVTIPSDDEVFALAEQYYLDDDLKVTELKSGIASIVSLSATTFTDDEKKKMREDAIKKYQSGVISEMKKKDEERKKKNAKKSAPVIVPDVKDKENEEEKPKTIQLNMFDL